MSDTVFDNLIEVDSTVLYYCTNFERIYLFLNSMANT